MTVTLTRSTDRRDWFATRPGDARAIGIGPTPWAAVESLWRWRPDDNEAADAQPKEDPWRP